MRTYLYLIMNVYTFNHIHHPGNLPVIPDGSTWETTSGLLHQKKVNKTQFDITKTCDNALKQKTLSAFYNNYVEGLANENVGFAQYTTIKTLNHLYNSYGTITPSEMEDATSDMVVQYDPSKPITKLYLQIEKGL